MPDTPLLTDPLLLQGLVNEMEPPEEFLGLSSLGTGEDYPYPTFSEEIVTSTREVAALNVPNSEAQIVGMLGVGEMSGKFMYARMKKLFEGTLLKWLRTPGDYARQRADAKISEEMADLVLRIDRLKEWIFWQIMTTGKLIIPINGVEITLDWQLPSNHKPTASTPWTTDGDSDGWYDADIISDLKVWRQRVIDDSNTVPTEIWVNSLSLDVLYKNKWLKEIWTDRMKEQILNQGFVSGILGYTWRTYDLTYVDHTGASKAYLPEGKLVLRNPADLIRLYNGPSPDAEAPDNTYGRFSKAWYSKDPSGYTGLVEDTFFMHLKRPKQLLCATLYTP